MFAKWEPKIAIGWLAWNIADLLAHPAESTSAEIPALWVCIKPPFTHLSSIWLLLPWVTGVQSRLLSVPLWHVLKGEMCHLHPGAGTLSKLPGGERSVGSHHHLPHFCDSFREPRANHNPKRVLNSFPLHTQRQIWTWIPDGSQETIPDCAQQGCPAFCPACHLFLPSFHSSIQLKTLLANAHDKHLTTLKRQSVLIKGVSQSLMKPWSLQLF